MSARVGLIGLGAMGSGMATRLLARGCDLAVHNRTRAKSDVLADMGARIADSPAELAADVDLVLLSLSDQSAVEHVLFSQEGVLAGLSRGTVVADTSTVSPPAAREISGRIAVSGGRPLDACVLGNAQHARDGELRIMVGGAGEDVALVHDLLALMGKQVTHLGSSGSGATMKLVLNLLMGIELQALAEAVVFGERAGLSRDTVIGMIASSGFSSPVMRFKAGVMERREFDRADFKLSLMRKDMGLVLDECRRLEVPIPASEAAHGMLTAAGQAGLGNLDCASILAFAERFSGLDGYPWPGGHGAVAP